ncbi:RnfABCDGE type electron transport complex subunit D [Cohnella ginsengisoli]|uniref:RnfABCDGE type electron transport complex subunit D n=1 Tax=Cohnella ginsengisoli TaxID=425004 RepID=A0A9X4KKX4_9BACL|nr:RnfABCDGE type electron transport complex subunit D [Cohnella ginsengisoli]MDG0793933.1 RnfABCDGE type electron transport complex subunit D [Cohnella ginsengisoli]
MKPKVWLKSPKGNVLLILLAFLGIASAASREWDGVKNALIAVASAVAFDAVCCLIERRKRIFLDGAFITGLIVALILSLTSPWYVVAATVAVSILSKHLLAYRKKPLFNPATFGLLLSVPIFHAQQSWWGAFGDLPVWLLPVVLIGGFWVTNRIQKFPQVFSFAVVYLLALFVLASGILPIHAESLRTGGFYDALRPPFINAALFFAMLMLTDPPTSPAKTADQVLFGVIVGAAGSVIYGLFGGLIYLYIGLLAGNVYQALRFKFSKRPTRAARPEPEIQTHRYLS